MAGEVVDVPALVTADWLAARLRSPWIRVADVRWYLPTTKRSGREEYERGHLPGAIFVDLDGDLARPAYEGPGRHPLPSAEAFAAAMGRLGIGDEHHVVAYDDGGGGVAARLWWLLRYFGHERVSVLDGGWEVWQAAHRPVETKAVTAVPARFTPRRPQQGWVVDKTIVQQLARDPSALVLDARAAERYEGRTEPIDRRPGHVPGARNAPIALNLEPSGPGGAPQFKSSAALRAQYEALGLPHAQKVVAYCGSGVNACQTLLALHVAGYPRGLLYEGSWSDWSADPTLPAALGSEPG